MGLFPSRVLSLLALDQLSTDPPLLQFTHQTQAAVGHLLQGISHKKLGSSLSRLPTLLGFVAFWLLMLVRASSGF